MSLPRYLKKIRRFRKQGTNPTVFTVKLLLKMVQRSRFRRATPDQVTQLQATLNAESAPDLPFFTLIVASCVIATLGLLSNSAAVIIGAMLVAPLMLPIRALAFAALEGDLPLFRQGVLSIVGGTGTAVALSFTIGRLADIAVYGSEIFARSRPNLLDLGIAIAAGGISGYAMIEPKISGTVAGTAIAVALMPPVCVIGLGLAQGNTLLSTGATLLYLTNLLGITLACMAAFLLQGYIPLARARRALTLAVVLTTILLIPLGISFSELVRQSHLESTLRQALLNRTITFQRLELVDLQTNWLVDPPEVRLLVRSKESITAKQVSLIEEFIAKSLGQPFTLIFEVSQLEEVRSRDGVR